MTENHRGDRTTNMGNSGNYAERIGRDYVQGNIYIYNYGYYSYQEELRVAPVKTAEALSDDNLPCPYRGLFHFSPNDAEFFFGREVFVKELVQATQIRNFIPVLGASGSGKSSVVFAGLVAKLQQEGHWKFTYFRPGSDSDPFYALAEALVPLYRSELDSTDVPTQAGKLAKFLKDGQPLERIFTLIQRNHPNQQLLLIADQFEEIYTVCTDEAIRKSFLGCLLTSIESSTNKFPYSTVLVATMRADFLGNALSYPRFADVLRNYDIKIRAMNRDELSQVIEKPAQSLGVMFEAGLVKCILDEVEDEPGNLPLLEFALTSLWSKRQGNQLTHKAYEEIGEIKGALTKYAEQKYSELNPNQQKQVQHIFVQLVRSGEGTEDTRRLATKDELGESRWSLVQKLANERLVVTNRNTAEQETVEIVHEALIHHWLRLRQWVNESREALKQRDKIEAAVKEWRNSGKSKDYLLQGKLLRNTKDWQKQQAANQILSNLAEEFITASITQRWKNQLKFVGFGLIVPLGLAVFLGVFGVNQLRTRELWQTYEKSEGSAKVQALQELVKIGASLNNIKLSRIDLSTADLNGAKLRGADLNGTILFGAKLRGASLNGANLSRADLSRADLSSADLRGAVLSDAKFYGTILQGANLRAVILRITKHSSNYLDNALLCNTIMSDGKISNRNCVNISAYPSPTNTDIPTPKIETPIPRNTDKVQPMTLAQALELAKRNHQGLSKEMFFQVSLDYYDLQQADEELRIAQSSVINAQATLRDAQALEQAAIGERSYVLRSQINLANAQLSLTNALSQQRIARSRLTSRLDLPHSVVSVIAADPVQIAGLWNLTLEQSVALALQNKSEQQQQRNDIRFQVEQAYSELEANLVNVQTTSISVEQAREALRLERLKFQAGLSSQSNVIEAENLLPISERSRILSIMDYNRALARLQAVIIPLKDLAK